MTEIRPHGSSPLKQSGLMLNIDINSVVTPFLNETARRLIVQESDLYPFIDQYANTQITDIALNVFCQFSNTPSRIFTDSLAKYLQKTENGFPVDYTDRYEGLYQITTRHELDVYAIWFRRCRQIGLRAWLSVRMNDAHCPDDDASFLRSDFFYLARRNNWMIGEKFGYYRHCLDYAVPEVRQTMLAYLEEQLDRYDVDGLELDWLREIYCFDTAKTPNAVAIINDFLRAVKAVVRRAEQKWGHRICILCRLMRDITQNLAFGFDAAAWAAESLVDVLAISPRWATCDSDMPVSQWLPLGRQIAIWAGLEILVNRQSSQAMATAEVAGGYAARYLGDGADKIYLYNYFQNPNEPVENLQTCFNTCGHLETLLARPRRYVVTWQDLCPEGFTPYRPLPVTLQSGDAFELAVNAGPVCSGDSIGIVFGCLKEDMAGQEEGRPHLQIRLNGLPCSLPEPAEIASFDAAGGQIGRNGYVGSQTSLFACRPDSSSPASALQTVLFCNNGNLPVTLNYLELAIR